MTTNSKKTWLIIAAILLYILGTIHGAHIHQVWTRSELQQIDTTTVMRTATLDSIPQTVISRPAPAEADPVIVSPERILNSQKDTTMVHIKPEVVEVSGKLTDGVTYQAILSGVQPSLQNLSISYPERTITKTVTKPYKGWIVSATADVAGYITPQFNPMAKVALETTYNTGPLHIGLQAGAIFTPGPWHASPYIGARFTVDIFKF